MLRKAATLASGLLLLACAATSLGEDHKARISLTERSNVSTAEIGKSLDSHCPDIVITIDRQKADYLLEARDTGAGALRKPYKFTLFSPAGDRVFSTEASSLDGATKQICGFIHKRGN